MNERRNVTLSLPRDLLRGAKRVAAERDTSVSALMTQALAELVERESRYGTAKEHAMAAIRDARPLGTNGNATWTRDELHER